MTETLALIILAYVFLLAMLALVLIYGRIHWLFKALLLALTAAFYQVSYQGWKQAQGWPTQAHLPDKFLLHASVIEEPDEEKGTPGRIFIWGSDLKGSFPASEPRAYELPYDREIHSGLEDALRNQRNGNVQIGGVSKGTEQGDQPRDMTGLGEEQQKLEFTNLPDPALPEK